MGTPDAIGALRAARDLLLANRDDPDTAYRDFRWPAMPTTFNWAVDWFDGVLVPERPDQTALLIVGEGAGTDEARTFRELSAAAARVSAFVR